MLNTTKLEKYRKSKKLSKQDFARFLAMEPSNYSMLLKNKTTSLATLHFMANKMSVKYKNLLED